MVHATIKNKKYLVDSGAINKLDVAQSHADIIIKEL